MGKGGKTFYGKLRTGMAVTGAVLLFFLFGKAIMGAPWKTFGGSSAEAGREILASVAAMVWRQSYPALGVEIERTMDTQNKEPWYITWIWNQLPVYHYAVSLGDKDKSYKEGDPSYIKYLEQQAIYKEHEYLFKDGGEETGETTVSLEETQAEEAVVEETTLAKAGDDSYTASSTHQIIGKQYAMAQLADYDFLMKNFYNVHPSTTVGRELMNAKSLLSQDFVLTTEKDKPQILIYHTHSQETFADYGPEHQDGTVVGIGTYLTQLLEAKNYHVIHDTSVYDLHDGKLDRNKAYGYALEGITAILQTYPSIEVVLDVHRDGVGENVRLVSEVNGKPTASIMFFNGTSQTPTGPIEYLQNPYRTDNLAFSLQMKLDAEAYYPGFTRKIYLKGLRYNLHLRPRSALLEIGAQTNTTEEAMNAMEPLAELLDMILQGE